MPESLIGVLLISAVLLITATIVGSWVFARWWCKPKREVPAKARVALEPPTEEVELRSSGVLMRGWLLRVAQAQPRPPAIILVHGWSRNSSELLPLAARLTKAGFVVLLYDSRGHGCSGDDGPITIRKFQEDILAALDYLHRRSDIDGDRIGVFGRSIGGSSAILAAAADRRVRALVTCSAFADPAQLTRDTLRMFHLPPWPIAWLTCRFIERWLRLPMAEVAPLNKTASIEVPILLIHGGADTYIRPSNAEHLYAQAPRDRTELLVIPTRRHADMLRDSTCTEWIVDFFVRTLARCD